MQLHYRRFFWNEWEQHTRATRDSNSTAEPHWEGQLPLDLTHSVCTRGSFLQHFQQDRIIFMVPSHNNIDYTALSVCSTSLLWRFVFNNRHVNMYININLLSDQCGFSCFKENKRGILLKPFWCWCWRRHWLCPHFLLSQAEHQLVSNRRLYPGFRPLTDQQGMVLIENYFEDTPQARRLYERQ